MLSSISHNPEKILESYLGPPPFDEGARYSVDYSKSSDKASDAPSYIPKRLLYIIKKEDYAQPVEKLLMKPFPWLRMLKEELIEDLKNHFESRIQSFFYQLLLTHKTGLQFIFHNKAEMQIGEAVTKGSYAPTFKQSGEYAAAHSSTLTSLRCTNSSGKVITFARGSFFFRTWNTTICLPHANIVDTALDITTIIEGLSFRQRCVYLLNLSSAGEMTPKQSIEAFLTNSTIYIEQLQKKEFSTEKQFVLQTYLEVIQAYQKGLSDARDSMIRSLCFLGASLAPIETIYMTAQSGMHALLRLEMDRLRPPPLIAPSSDPARTPLRFKEAIAKKWDEAANRGLLKTDSPTAAQYIELCLSNSPVRNEAVQYFSEVDEKALHEDLDLIISKKAMPARWVKIKNAAEAIIKEQKNKIPKQLTSILVTVLREISADPSGQKSYRKKEFVIPRVKSVAARALAFPTPPLPESEPLPQLVSSFGMQQIRQILEENSEEYSKTAINHAKLCSQDAALCKIALNYLKEVPNPETLKNDLMQIKQVSKASDSKSLSREITKVYEKTLEIIKEKTGKTSTPVKLHPRKIGLTILSLLTTVVTPPINQQVL